MVLELRLLASYATCEYVFAYFGDWASGGAYVFYGADVFGENIGIGEALAYFSGAADSFDLCKTDHRYTDADGAVAVWIVD